MYLRLYADEELGRPGSSNGCDPLHGVVLHCISAVFVMYLRLSGDEEGGRVSLALQMGVTLFMGVTGDHTLRWIR